MKHFIDFSTLQVRAMFEGGSSAIRVFVATGASLGSVSRGEILLSYATGDTLIGREDFTVTVEGLIRYAATDHIDDLQRILPASRMSRKESRIILDVTGARIEKLSNMTEADAVAEGIAPEDWTYTDGQYAETSLEAFNQIWALSRRQSIEANRNDWVAVIEFRKSAEMACFKPQIAAMTPSPRPSLAARADLVRR